MIKRILVGLGGTPFTRVATRRAIELAQAHGAELTGITILGSDRLDAESRERVENAAQSFKNACSDAAIVHQVEQETGDPFDLLLSHAHYHDVIVFGLRSLFDYGLVDEPHDALVRLVREGVRPIIAAAPEYRAVRRVLVAYSGSMESAKAMKRFVQLRPWEGVALQIVRFGRKTDEAEQLLGDAATYCRCHGFEVEVKHLSGSATDGLLPHAKQSNADLIVLGESLRSLLARHLLGDTLVHVIRNSDRPLFLAQ